MTGTPRPRPTPAPPPQRPAPRPAPAVPATSDKAPALTDNAASGADEALTAATAGDAVGQSRVTRAHRRAQERGSSRGSWWPLLLSRAAAVVCVAAGVVTFVVARGQHPSDARAVRASPSPSTSSAADDPQALLAAPSQADAVLAAASDEVVTVTQSDYRSLDDSLAAGLGVTTGEFRTRFRAALTGAAAAQRIAQRATTGVQVLQTAIGTISDGGTRAKVLLFAQVDQSGTDVAASARSVVVTLCASMVRRGAQYLIDDLQRNVDAGLPAGTAGLKAAAEAAREEVANTLTYRRASFAADLARAENGAAGALRTQIATRAAAVRTELTRRDVDLTGAVTAVSVQQAEGDSATLLVAASGVSTTSAGASTLQTDGHYVVTLERVSGTWLATSLTAVTI